MNRIETKFKQLKKNGKKAFIAFITAGYPDLRTTEKLVLGLSGIGVDIIELGVPFSDPLADGPVIQEASFESLKKKTHLVGILNLVKRARKLTQTPICLMTYYNPVFNFGDEKFAKTAVACGVDGVIIPDLPPDEGAAFIKICNKYKLDVISFIAPTTSQERMKFISKVTKGFIYYVSLTGVTGEHRNLPKDLVNNLKTIRRITKNPVCVGFGVSSRNQVAQVNKIADGAIVGSAIVKRIKENINKPDLVRRVIDFVAGLKNV
ncbi:MAG: tryptophan synthase subunit alpha [Candidatus Omnitrophota bacterium]|jgi:tryptophan synthase alpha chain